MSKNILAGICTFLLLGLSTVYSNEKKEPNESAQNNLPRQHQTMGAFSEETPIIINADLLYGRVIGDQGFYGNRTDNATAGSRTNQELFDWPNQSRFGFRVGLGVGLGQNIANLSVQYTWLQSKDHESIRPTAIAPVLILLGTSQFVAISVGNPELSASQHLRYQTLDASVQAASWMLGSKTRLQPLGGVRYLYYKRTLDNKIKAEGITNNPFTQDRFKLHATGPFVGVDIKFIVYRNFHFFTNTMIGILSGHDRRIVIEDLSTTTPSIDENRNRTAIVFDPFWEIRFGFAWSHLFNNDWLLALRLAYELMSFIQNDAPVVTEFAPGISALKTQAVSFGFILTF